MIKKFYISLLTLILVISCQKTSRGLKSEDMSYLINSFLHAHAKYHNIDDNISERIYSNYISNLDPGKNYFYKSDIELFERHKLKLDDYINSGDYNKIYEIIETEIFSTYKKRYSENMALFSQLIENDFDFTIDENIITDKNKIDYAVDKNDMKERWRKNIKLQLLNYISSGKGINESKAKLKKKYELFTKRTGEIKNEDIIARFINSVSTALDPHSNYLTHEEQEDFKINIELKLEGIGTKLRSEDGFVIIESIIAGGATDKLPEKIKLKPDDKIVAVAQGNSEPVYVIDTDLRDVVKMIRGKKGTEVRLTILRDVDGPEKQKRMIVPIIREEIKLEDSDARSDVFTSNTAGQKIKIGYIKLPSFYQDTAGKKSSAGDVNYHLRNLMSKDISCIVLDLRGNPGGLLRESIKIAGLFIEEGPIVQIKNNQTVNRYYVKRNKNQAWIQMDNGIDAENNFTTLYKGPLVVLIDKFSASASEIISGALKDYRRSLIIGPRSTFGKGTVQSYNVLPGNKGAIKITTHIFYQPKGTSNQLYGIEPDITVPSFSSVWEIGEDKTNYPLEWEKIEEAQFKPYGLVDVSIIGSLKSRTSQRVNSDKQFSELVRRINKYIRQNQEKTISLMLESTIEQQKDIEELENKFIKQKEKDIMDIENDLFLKEAFNIASDYVMELKKSGTTR